MTGSVFGAKFFFQNPLYLLGRVVHLVPTLKERFIQVEFLYLYWTLAFTVSVEFIYTWSREANTAFHFVFAICMSKYFVFLLVIIGKTLCK